MNALEILWFSINKYFQGHLCRQNHLDYLENEKMIVDECR